MAHPSHPQSREQLADLARRENALALHEGGFCGWPPNELIDEPITLVSGRRAHTEHASSAEMRHPVVMSHVVHSTQYLSCWRVNCAKLSPQCAHAHGTGHASKG